MRTHFSITPLASLSLTFLILSTAAAQTPWQNLMDDGTTLQRQGCKIEAKADYLDALALAQMFTSTDPRPASSLNHLCAVDYELGQLTEAEKFCSQALAQPDAATEESRLITFTSLHLSATVDLLSGRQTHARQMIERMQPLLDALSHQLTHFRGLLLYDTAFLDVVANRLPDAENRFLESIACFRKNEADSHSLATALTLLSGLLIFRHCFAQAENYTHEALAILTARYGADHPETILDYVNLARVYLLTRRTAEAEPLLEHALSIAEKSYGPDDPSVAIVAKPYADALKKLGQKAKARIMAERATNIFSRLRANNVSQYVVDVKSLTSK